MSTDNLDSEIIDLLSLRELEFLSTNFFFIIIFVIFLLIAKISIGFLRPVSALLSELKLGYQSILEVDCSVPLTHYDPKCLEKKRKIRFRILSDLRIQSWILIHRTKQGR